MGAPGVSPSQHRCVQLCIGIKLMHLLPHMVHERGLETSLETLHEDLYLKDIKCPDSDFPH